MNILLAVDGSDASSAAVALMRRLPLPRESQVTIVGVIEEALLTKLERFLAPGEAEDYDRWKSEARQETEANVSSACDALSGTWNCSSIIRVGNVAEEVLEQATQSDANLIVLGTSADTKLVPFTQGGKRQKIIGHAPCSVLVARAGPNEAKTSRPFRILLAHDGSPHADLAVQELKQLRLAEADVSLLSVMTVATTLYGRDILERLQESWQAYRRECEQTLSQVASELVAHQVEGKLIDGGVSPEDDILEYAEQGEFDLIMLGATGRGGLQKFFLGSVASRVAQHAPCSVWVARPNIPDGSD